MSIIKTNYYLMQILEDTQLTKQQNFGRPQL